MSTITRTIRSLDIPSYRDADNVLGKKDVRTIAHNTTLKRDGEVIRLYHWATPIITYTRATDEHRQGTLILRVNGWYSMTTKERLNGILARCYHPAHGYMGGGIYSERGVWMYHQPPTLVEQQQQTYLHTNLVDKWLEERTVVFFDGMEIDADTGRVINSSSDAAVQAKQRVADDRRVTRLIRAYVASITAEGVAAAQDMAAGDCWYCALRGQDGTALGETTGNTDHLRSHLDDGYVPFNLIVNAYRDRRYPNPSLVLSIDLADIERSSDSERSDGMRRLRRHVSQYLKARLLEGPRTMVNGTQRTANHAFGGA